jgi:dCMP deaminase
MTTIDLPFHYPYSEPNPQLKWHSRFITLATHIADWSKDPSTKVGAVIVDDERRVVSLGYNGLPRGMVDHDYILNNKELKLQVVKHAEENAILNSLLRPAGCTIYVTHHPCSSCAGSIVQSGIRRVVFPTINLDSTFPDRWRQSISLAQTIFEEAGIEVIEL